MLGFDKLIEGYCVDEFLTEELSLLANAQLLLDLVKERKYLGITHTVSQGKMTSTRSSIAAAVLRGIKRSINKLAIEE